MTLVSALPIAKELAQVYDEIKQFSQLPDEPLNRIADVSMAMGGKHLRATLLLLTSKLYGPVSPQIIKIAALVELLHTATLIHDDVLDNAATRRGHPSMNKQWGSEIAILYGNYILCHVFVQMYDIQPHIVRYFSETLRDMCVGAILETTHHFDGGMTEELYLSIVDKKTAALFRTCCLLGPVLQNKDNISVEALSNFGLEAGMAFQIIDDILDITGTSSTLGKPAVNDISHGKLTLPIIYALNSATLEEKTPIFNSFAKHEISTETQAQLNGIIKKYQGVEHARNTAVSYMKRAKAILEAIPQSDVQQAMRDIADLFIQRVF